MRHNKIRNIDDFNKTYFPKQYEKDYYEKLSPREKVKYDVQKMFNRFPRIIISKG